MKMNKTVYLYINQGKFLVVKCKKYTPVKGWQCYGKYKDGTKYDLQACDNDYVKFCSDGFDGLGIIDSVSSLRGMYD